MNRAWIATFGLLLACSTAKTATEQGDAGNATVADAASDGSALSDSEVVGDVAQVGTQFPICDPAAKTQRVSFVHTNDLHASYEPGPDGISPIARIIGFLKDSRKANPYTVFTDGGDIYEKGSVAELISKGQSTREIIRAMQFDVRVIGNHDYAWSQAEVLANSQDPHAIVLSSNMEYIGDDPSQFKAVPYTVLQVGCVKVGFFGLTSSPWDSTDSSISGPFYPEFPASYDFFGIASDMVAKHRSEVDLLIAVNHIGIELDRTLVAATPGLDAVLSGHSHTFTEVPSDDGISAPVVQSGAFCAHVVRLDLDVDLQSRQVTHVGFETAGLSVGSTLTVDDAINKTVTDIVRKYAPNWDKASGTLKGAVGQVDAAKLAAKAEIAVLGTDAALVDVHTTWAQWSPGPLTQQDEANMFKVEREPAGSPGFNAAYTAKILGSELQKLNQVDPANWALIVPTTIDPAKTYTIGMQKRTALNPAQVPFKAQVSAPQAEMEMWEVLDKFAQARTKACHYVDSDDKLAVCP